uniref:Uncharacterized protein n=1 Tax=Panstrongylus lignarius TaxID=156445 RepID=A0A224XTA9_9HEMI
MITNVWICSAFLIYFMFVLVSFSRFTMKDMLLCHFFIPCHSRAVNLTIFILLFLFINGMLRRRFSMYITTNFRESYIVFGCTKIIINECRIVIVRSGVFAMTLLLIAFFRPSNNLMVLILTVN